MSTFFEKKSVEGERGRVKKNDICFRGGGFREEKTGKGKKRALCNHFPFNGLKNRIKKDHFFSFSVLTSWGVFGTF